MTPEDYLERAMGAKTARGRGTWARRGLAYPGAIDRTTQAMLLRQLYLSLYLGGEHEQAYGVACQALELDVLRDVVHQDAARARQALGDVDGAAGHLRLAARTAPPSRRAFHWWTLGAVLFVAGRHQEAVSALERAARWGTSDKPLYQGHLALAKCAAGKKVRGMHRLIRQLAACPAGQGYGRFVLGQLAYESELYEEARAYLQAFVERTTSGREATAIALHGELQMARTTLAELATA